MDHKLYLEVLDHNLLVANEVIGRMAIPIREIIKQKTLPLSWYKLLGPIHVGKE